MDLKVLGDNDMKQRKIDGISRLARAYFDARKNGTIEIITVPAITVKSDKSEKSTYLAYTAIN